MQYLPFLAFLFVWVSPAEAAPTRGVRSDPAPDAEIAAMNAELTVFGEWLSRLLATQAPMQEALVGLQGRWQAAMARSNGAREFRTAVDEVVAEIDRANAALDTLQPMELQSVPLAPELQPAAIMRSVRRINGELRTAMRTFYPVLEAIQRDDEAGATRALGTMMASMKLVLESQLLLTRAGLAATPREESSWEMLNVDLIAQRAVIRAIGAWPANLHESSDATIAADLITMADEVRETKRAGLAKVEEERSLFSDALRDAEGNRDSETAFLFRRNLDLLAVSEQVFTVADGLEVALRSAAARMQSGRVTLPDLARLMADIRPLRLRMDAIAAEEAAVISRAD